MPTRVVIIATLYLFSAAAWAMDYRIDAAHSNITATFKQMNVPVDAPFRRFTGRIDYDPEHRAAAKAELQVTTASFDLGDEAYNAEVQKKEWFDSTAIPLATFVASAAQPLRDGRLAVTGTFTLKNKPQTLTVPITVKTNGDSATFDGSFTVSRAAFNIGSAEWKDTVDDTVTIRLHLLATRR